MEKKQSIGKAIASGLFWTYLERISSQVVTVLVTIILARLLDPEHSTIIAIVTSFISICDTLVVGGFSDTLIQEKGADQVDFSTVFWFVLGFGFVMYGIVWMLAPYVELYFKTDMVTVTMRVMAIRLPISAINSVQSAYISKQMKYRYFFFATFVGTMISAVVGVVMAYMGFGVWALVGQYMSNSIIDTMVLWFTCGWRPSFLFNFQRFKKLYMFGLKMMLSNLLGSVYAEVESFCIGGKNALQLSYYEKGRQFPRLIINNVQLAINKVMLPAYSKVKEDKERLKEMGKRSVCLSSYLIAPMIIGLMFCAREFVSAVLTDKWLPAVPFLRIIAVYYLLQPIMMLNRQIVIACGEASKYLWMEIEKKVTGVILLAIATFCFDSVYMIAVATALNQCIGVFIQSAPLKKLINYPISEQIRDVGPVFLLSAGMGIPILLISTLSMWVWAKLALEVLAGILFYLAASWVLKLWQLNYLLEMVFKTLKIKRKEKL